MLNEVCALSPAGPVAWILVSGLAMGSVAKGLAQKMAGGERRGGFPEWRLLGVAAIEKKRTLNLRPYTLLATRCSD